jgi:signal transduction histidine kinase
MTLKDQHIRRILIVEKMIMMPVKAAFLLLSFLFFWAPDQMFHIISKSFFFYQSVLYFLANVIFYAILTWAQSRQWSLAAIKTSAFLIAIIDNLYLSFLIPLTGGLESPIYWIYSGLMIRNAVNFPLIREQGLINLAFCVFYGSAVYFSERESDLFLKEVFYLRIIVLVLVSICCWGIYVLIQRRVKAKEEEQELQLRREKIHAIRRIAGDIAHGLKNPLSIINNAAYYLLKHDLNGNMKNQLEIIQEEIKRSNKILSQIMDYSKLSNVKLIKLNVNEVLKGVMDEVYPETTFPGVRFEKKFQKRLPSVFFDEGHLKQIFSNLLINAAEAIVVKNGGNGVLTVYTELGEDKELMIRFVDDGLGIDSEVMSKIFNPFFTTKQNGTGLGLSIAKNLVETYDGDIQVRSEKGKGSTFLVRLPVRAKVHEAI